MARRDLAPDRYDPTLAKSSTHGPHGSKRDYGYTMKRSNEDCPERVKFFEELKRKREERNSSVQLNSKTERA